MWREGDEKKLQIFPELHSGVLSLRRILALMMQYIDLLGSNSLLLRISIPLCVEHAYSIRGCVCVC